MEWLDYMNAALDYIEENLSVKINMDKVAEKAACSPYNFQRMFSFITGVTLATYIRRRCMTAAALELLHSNDNIIDVAFKYGYESPVSFSRTFYSIHKIAPSEAKREGANMELYPKISFQISIKGDVPMKFRIEKMNGFTLAGISREFTCVNGENFEKIPQMWQEFNTTNLGDVVFNMNHRELEETYGVCYDFNFEADKFRYMIAAKPEGEIPEGCEVVVVPELTWVKFECRGAHQIQEVFKRMYTEWFPTSGYEHADGPEIEWYSTDDPTTSDYHCEVWVPIKKL